jgi:hypothetical protein
LQLSILIIQNQPFKTLEDQETSPKPYYLPYKSETCTIKHPTCFYCLEWLILNNQNWKFLKKKKKKLKVAKVGKLRGLECDFFLIGGEN